MLFIKNKKKAKQLVCKSNEVEFLNFIPEPTKSLIFFTNENPSMAHSSMSTALHISLGSINSEKNNFFSEPSLIWGKLPIYKNNNVDKKPIYFPSYIKLNPEQRYQYILWLSDVARPTNLSYVFLYYYGLERHLLIGDFEKAVEEVLRLLKFHDKGSFRHYAQNALIASILYKKRFDLFAKYSFVFEGLSNEILLIRKYLNSSLTAEEIVMLSSKIGFKKRYYINKHRAEFIGEVKDLLLRYENKNGLILSCIRWGDLKIEETSFFGNISIPKKISNIKVPQLLKNDKFKEILFFILERSYSNLKIKKCKNKANI